MTLLKTLHSRRANDLPDPNRPKERYLMVFLIALGVTVIFFLPFIIMDNGLFLYYGDYNVQQIPFYKMAQEAIRTGNTAWSWTTDLGANFVGSYSFYLLGSPFFWLTTLFPTAWVPYLMMPLFALKYATCAVTGYAFIRRFVTHPDYALLGGLLYAFSGFNAFNIFFNHFHEVVAFFPLLLIALEEAVVNKRKGVFALAVALNAVVNYFFFAGEVVFLFIYFFVRCFYKDFDITPKRFFCLAAESILGIMLAAGLMLPSALALASNPRTSEFLTGWPFLLYGDVQKYPLIFESFFFPPDIPARPNFLPDSNAQWSSVAGFLPLFGMAGVLSFLKNNKRHWVKTLLIICIVMAFVPGLNSAFVLFNNAYYGRWFYMPILLMALATVLTLERRRSSMKFGLIFSAIVIAVAAVIGIVPTYSDGNYKFGTLPPFPDRFWGYIAIAVVCLIATALLVYFRPKRKLFIRLAAIGICLCTVTYTTVVIACGKSHGYSYNHVVNMGLKGRENIHLPDDNWFRIDTYECMDNYGMYWNRPTINAFHSVVPGSIMDFYSSMGIDRGVGSRPEISYYGLRTLTSVQYLFYEATRNDAPAIPGFSFYKKENGFKILKNDNFVPMGFVYDHYVDEKTFEDYSESSRDRLMLKGIYLDDAQIRKYKNTLTPVPEDILYELGDEDLTADADRLRAKAAYDFTTDNKGFTSKVKLDRSNLVFYSVPYDEGWTAYVNGKPAKIERVNVGFMAVEAPAGDNEIRFEYETPGLKTGLLISLGGLLLLVGYLLWMRRLAKKNPDEFALEPRKHLIFVDTVDELRAQDAYVDTLVGKCAEIGSENAEQMHRPPVTRIDRFKAKIESKLPKKLLAPPAADSQQNAGEEAPVDPREPAPDGECTNAPSAETPDVEQMNDADRIAPANTADTDESPASESNANPPAESEKENDDRSCDTPSDPERKEE